MIGPRILVRRFLQAQSGTASTEFALLLPMLIVLMFGGSEAGHFVWTQHKLAEAVRDGARYAARTQISDFCEGANEVMTTDQENLIKLITRTGQLNDSAARPVVPGWTDAQVTVTVSCDVASLGSEGIYAALGDNDANGTTDAGPVVTVSATGVSYPSLFNSLGILNRSIRLSAKSSAAVIGI